MSARLPHVYIGVPQGWDFVLPLEERPVPITLAQVVPVSEREYGLWKQNVLGFTRVLEAQGVDLADLKRPG